MKLLCIDTTKQQAILALSNDGCNTYVTIPDTKKHSEALLMELENFLCTNKLTIKDITHLGCVTGPGSFTGIRIGMATIKAFSFALNLPIVSDSYFNIVSSTIKNGYAVLKNTSTAVYMSKVYCSKAKEIEVVDNSAVLDVVKDKKLYVSEYEQIEELKAYNQLETITNYPEIMLNHFVDKVEKGEFSDAEFAPVYAQLSQAEKNLKG